MILKKWTGPLIAAFAGYYHGYVASTFFAVSVIIKIRRHFSFFSNCSIANYLPVTENKANHEHHYILGSGGFPGG